VTAEPIVEPREVANLIERYVSQALADARKYDNSQPLDDSGVFTLHRLGARIYALGFDAGEQVANVRESGMRQRQRDATREEPT
jgi:hypothetical protein